jgi:ParB-like chromosome segregation protein Spo0J
MQVALIDPSELLVLGVDIEPIGELQAARVDHRAKEFGQHEGDDGLVRDVYCRNVQKSVSVRKVGDKLEVVDGQRRTMAARLANEMRVKTGDNPWCIPITIESRDDLESLRCKVSLNRNTRADDPIELGRMLEALVSAMQKDSGTYLDAVRKAAQDANCSEGSVRNYIKLTRLSLEVQDQVRLGHLGIAVAVALSGRDEETQSKTAAKLIEQGRGKDAKAARNLRDGKADKKGITGKHLRDMLTLFDLEPAKYEEHQEAVLMVRVILGEKEVSDLPWSLKELVTRAKK